MRRGASVWSDRDGFGSGVGFRMERKDGHGRGALTARPGFANESSCLSES